MAGHAQDVQVAIADLENEQDVDPPQRDRAVDVKKVIMPAGAGTPTA
jgi:hypothetical protein